MTLRVKPAAARDQGQAAPLMVVVLLVVVAVVLVTVQIGRLAHFSAQARTAADAAALAGAAAGRGEAETVAAANGAVLTSYAEQYVEQSPSDTDTAGVMVVTVSVKVGQASHTARAEAVVEWTPA